MWYHRAGAADCCIVRLAPRFSRELPMRETDENETWVVFQALQGQQSGIRSVCTQSEWTAIVARQPGLNQLVREGITSETEAEKLARGTSGDEKKRQPRRGTPPSDPGTIQ